MYGIKIQHPLRKWFLLLVLVLVVGVLGYTIVEDYSFFDALYMAVITIATIGYHEVRPLSEAGKIFNIVFIITSFVTFTYVLARVTQSIANGELTYYFNKKRLMQELEKMQGHVIICGYGRNGQQAAKTLKAHKLSFVVIEKNEEAMRRHRHEDHELVYLGGDATEDEMLLMAGIERSKAILITLPDDADNVFIVLSARSLNSHIHIISRASS